MLWLGLSPEQDFLDFLLGWQVFGLIGGIVAAYAMIIAFLFGWDPRAVAGSWIRKRLVLPVLLSKKILVVCCFFGLIFAGLQLGFLDGFAKINNPELKRYLLTENFAAIDNMAKSGSLNDSEFWRVVNDSMRQQFFSTSQNAELQLCRDHLEYLANYPLNFRPAWHRYFAAFALASCRQVLEDPKASLRHYREAASIARFLNVEDLKLINRKIAAIYIYDSDGQTDITDITQRSNKVISLIADDKSFTAQRILGTAYFYLKEYLKAAEIWNDSLNNSGNIDLIESKKLLNNISFAYQRAHQYQLAIQRAAKGVEIPFDATDEVQRREQIRVLSTLSSAYLEAGDCNSANTTWDVRNQLKQQELSQCTSLIEVQIRSCQLPVDNYDAFLNSLLHGVGQDPQSFIDKTPEAIRTLVQQAELKFSDCYVGLEFSIQDVEKAALSGL